MFGCKSVRSLLPLAHSLYENKQQISEQQVVEMHNFPYRYMLGSLMYLSTWTRPDIATDISMLAKFKTNPAPAHWKAMKDLQRYRDVTTHYGLWLPSTHVTEDVYARSDAVKARDHTQRCLLFGLEV